MEKKIRSAFGALSALIKESYQRQWASSGRSQPKMPAKIRFMVKNSQPHFLRLMMRKRAGSINSPVKQRMARVKNECEFEARLNYSNKPLK